MRSKSNLGRTCQIGRSGSSGARGTAALIDGDQLRGGAHRKLTGLHPKRCSRGCFGSCSGQGARVCDDELIRVH